MNIERLKQLRDHIAALPPERTDMDYLHRYSDCGSVCCIAGWAAHLQNPHLLIPTMIINYEARKFLEIKPDTSGGLFYASVTNMPGKDEALSRLDYAIANGGNFNLNEWLETLPKRGA